jgi:hypothetical protein
MTTYRDQIDAALQAAAVRGPVRYAWLGRVSRPVGAALESAMDEAARNAYLVTSLSHELYSSFYCHGRPVPARWGAPAPLAPDPGLATALSDANAGRGCWQSGWTVERLDDHEAVVVSDVRARVPLSSCRAPEGIRAGTAVEIRVPKEHLWLAPGFYTALSDTAAESDPEDGVLRAYWHVTPTGAPALMRALTTRLNADGVPFRFKVADHPFRLDRCDGAVLYLPPSWFATVRTMLIEVAGELGEHLRPATPAFTLVLAPGVGLAEHDGGPVSFGTLRSRLLAEAVVHAHRLGVGDRDTRVAIAVTRFAEAGVAIDAPYRESSLAGGHVL